jgi:tetratricopeptide (TPR) repeat protein
MKALVLFLALAAAPRAFASAEGEATLEVGLAETRRGSFQTAVLALERAVRLLPRSARAAAALGTAYARLGRLALAEAELERARRLGDRSASTLLEIGIVRVRRGDYARARAPLREARERADADLRGAARFIESLADLRLGDADAARRGFSEAERAGGDIAEQARRMLELARPPPRLSLFATVRGEHDSNALLLPGTPSTIPLPEPEDDFALFVSAGIRARPFSGIDLALRDEVILRELRTVNELDLLGNIAGIDYRLPLGPHALTAGYQFEYFRLAGDPYLLAHRVGLGWEQRISESARLGLSFAVQIRRFQNPSFAPFSGEGYQGRISAILLGPPSPITVEAGYAPALERTEEADLGFHGHSFFASATWQPRSWLWLSAGADLTVRFFLEADEVLGETRREVQPAAWGALTLRPARPVRFVLAASFTHNAARPAFYEYDRLVISLATVLDIDAL